MGKLGGLRSACLLFLGASWYWVGGMRVIERKRKRASQGLAGHALHVHSGDPATLSSGEGRSGRPGGPGSHQSRREGGGEWGPRREEESHG